MPRTNHQRDFVENPNNQDDYIVLELTEVAPDGVAVTADARGIRVDHCCGKHGAAKDRSGAKKFVHSRVRRRTRDWLIDKGWEDEDA